MSILKRFWPLLLIFLGILLILGGNLYYALIEDGLSDLNPLRQHASSLISLSGSFILLVGMVAGITCFIVRRIRSEKK